MVKTTCAVLQKETSITLPMQVVTKHPVVLRQGSLGMGNNKKSTARLHLFATVILLTHLPLLPETL